MKTIAALGSISRKAGGLQQSVRRLQQSTNELPGIKVSVTALLDEYSVQDAPQWLPLTPSLCRVVGPRAFGFSPGFLPSLLQAEGDILHSHGIWQYPSVAVNRWHQKTGKPYLVSPHGMLDPWAVRNSRRKKRFALALYERRHLEKASCIRALCESEARAIREFGLRNPICIIPNAMDLPPSNGHGQKSGGPLSEIKKTGRKVLLYLGRIHPKKGLLNLIRAWAAIKAPEWVLAIAGWDQGGHEAELKSLCRECNIPFTDVPSPGSPLSASDSVCFLGPQFDDAKSACYSACDAFVLPSVSEGLPMVILEAWAYGKPVLMTPQCNLPEGFDAKAAIRIEPNVESIMTGLRFLFHAPAGEIAELGRNGRILVAERFNWPKCAADMIHVYHWLLGSGVKPACVTDF